MVYTHWTCKGVFDTSWDGLGLDTPRHNWLSANFACLLLHQVPQ